MGAIVFSIVALQDTTDRLDILNSFSMQIIEAMGLPEMQKIFFIAPFQI